MKQLAWWTLLWLLLAPSARAGGPRVVTQDGQVGARPALAADDMVVTFDACATGWEISTGRYLGVSEVCGERRDPLEDDRPWRVAPERGVAFALTSTHVVELQLGTLEATRSFELAGDPSCRPRFVAVSPSARVLAASGDCGALAAWDLDTGEALGRWTSTPPALAVRVLEDSAGRPVVLAEVPIEEDEVLLMRPGDAAPRRVDRLQALRSLRGARGLDPLEVHDLACRRRQEEAPEGPPPCYDPYYSVGELGLDSQWETQELLIVAPLRAQPVLRRVKLGPDSRFGLAGSQAWWTQAEEGRTYVQPIDLSAPPRAVEGLAREVVSTEAALLLLFEDGQAALLKPGQTSVTPITGADLEAFDYFDALATPSGDLLLFHRFTALAARIDTDSGEARLTFEGERSRGALEWSAEGLVFPGRRGPSPEQVLTWPLPGDPTYAKRAEGRPDALIRWGSAPVDGGRVGVTRDGRVVTWRPVDSGSRPIGRLCVGPEEEPGACQDVRSPVGHFEMGAFTGGVVDPEGRYAVLHVRRGLAVRVDLETGTQAPVGLGEICDSWNQSVGVRGDLERLAVARGRCAAVLDTATLEPRARLALPPEAFDLESMAFSPDGRFVAGQAGLRTFLFDASTGAHLTTLFVQDPARWAVLDPEGRLDRSTPSLEALHFVIEVDGHLESLGLEQLDRYYYEPRLLEKLLDPTQAPRPVVGLDPSQLPPSVRWDRRGDTLEVSLRDRGGGVGRVALFVNGAEVAADVRPHSGELDAFAVDLTPYARFLRGGDEDSMRLVAWNAAERLSSRGVGSLVVEPPEEAEPARINLYALVVGTGAYEDPRLSLRYATEDARAVADALRAGGEAFLGPSGGEVQVTLLSTEAGERPPSQEALDAAFARIAEAARPDDILVVYLSGHGVSVDGQYHYPWPQATGSDLGDPELLAARSLTQDQLMALIRSVPANKRLLVLDTCESGGVADGARSQLTADAQKRAVEELKHRMGMTVLVGAPADRSAYEHASLGHGLLTYALLEGLRGEALQDGRYWDVSTLTGHAVDRVPEIAQALGQGDVQRPLESSPSGSRSFRFGVLPADPEALPALRPLGQPVVSGGHLVHAEEAVDALALSDAVAASMAALASDPSAGFRWSEAVAPEAWILGGLYQESKGGLRVELGLLAPDGQRWRVTLSAATPSAAADCAATWTRQVIARSADEGAPVPPRRLEDAACVAP